MHRLYELKDKLMKELEGYAENGKFSEKDVEAIKYITSSIDHICNIVEDADEEEYSGRYYDSRMPMNDGRGGAYTYGGNGGSYARGRGGRMSRRGRNQYGSYGYSRAAEDLVSELRELVKDAPNDAIRQEMKDLIQKVEMM